MNSTNTIVLIRWNGNYLFQWPPQRCCAIWTFLCPVLSVWWWCHLQNQCWTASLDLYADQWSIWKNNTRLLIPHNMNRELSFYICVPNIAHKMKCCYDLLICPTHWSTLLHKKHVLHCTSHIIFPKWNILFCSPLSQRWRIFPRACSFVIVNFHIPLKFEYATQCAMWRVPGVAYLCVSDGQAPYVWNGGTKQCESIQQIRLFHFDFVQCHRGLT